MQEKFQALRKAYPGRRLLIVSNSTGAQSDKDQLESELLERETGVKVFRHSVKVYCPSHDYMVSTGAKVLPTRRNLAADKPF